MQIQPVILAGGKATRFGGRFKGLERVGGVRMLDRLADDMTQAFGRAPLLVANVPEAGEWRPDCTVVADLRPDLGAVGGIYTAVVAGPAPVVVAAWDMPFVSVALLRRLAEGLATADAMLPASDGRRGVEPLCAAYGPACRDAIERAVAEADLRAIGFHRFARVDTLSVDQVRAFLYGDRKSVV